MRRRAKPAAKTPAPAPAKAIPAKHKVEANAKARTRATSPPRPAPRSTHLQRNSRRTLDQLLALRNEHPERLVEIDRRIHQAFAETHAVMVLDMCGFSRLTIRHGITHFLAMIHRLRAIVAPVIAARAGRVVKTEADNVFAVFPDVAPAVEAARAIQRELRAANVYLPEDWDLHASLGIGWGELLMVGGDDLYGNEMNIASKLGEDVAGSGEVLLTEAAHARVTGSPPSPAAPPARASARRRAWPALADAEFEPRQVPLAGTILTAYKLLDG
jgi:class 3 adenylate cyclase